MAGLGVSGFHGNAERRRLLMETLSPPGLHADLIWAQYLPRESVPYFPRGTASEILPASH